MMFSSATFLPPLFSSSGYTHLRVVYEIPSLRMFSFCECSNIWFIWWSFGRVDEDRSCVSFNKKCFLWGILYFPFYFYVASPCRVQRCFSLPFYPSNFFQSVAFSGISYQALCALLSSFSIACLHLLGLLLHN